mgnify:CR=1 FL=1
MSIKIIHIPSAIQFEVPSIYGETDEDVENYISWYAWCSVCQKEGIRFMLAYANSDKENRDRMFQFNRYEYMIVREDD